MVAVHISNQETMFTTLRSIEVPWTYLDGHALVDMRLHCNWPPTEMMEKHDKQLSWGKQVALQVVGDQAQTMKQQLPATTPLYYQQSLGRAVSSKRCLTLMADMICCLQCNFKIIPIRLNLFTFMISWDWHGTVKKYTFYLTMKFYDFTKIYWLWLQASDTLHM